MKYIVYLTINKINQKIYIGVHKTENPDVFDGYLGNGIFVNSPKTYQRGKEVFHAAVRKYGVSAFLRITLKVFDTRSEALELEKKLVNEEFIKRTDTYNMIIGGGIPPILSKTVYQFNLDGTLIKKWNSQVEIRKFYKLSKDVILECIKLKRCYKNSYWSLNPEINVREYRRSVNPYEVYLYNSEGLLLLVFKSAKDAALKLDLNRLSIIGAVFGHTKLYGCFFLRGDDNIQDILSERKNRINLSSKAVYRYTLNGDYDREFSSQTEACKECSLRMAGLSSAIKNNRPYHGYKWSYIKDNKYNSYLELKPVKVAQYDLEHNLIKVFDSLSECLKQFPYARKVCRHERKHTLGYIFEYIS